VLNPKLKFHGSYFETRQSFGEKGRGEKGAVCTFFPKNNS